jgi:hypothetical protein
MDEGDNLSTLAQNFPSIVNYILKHFWFFGRIHVLTMFLAKHTCQYAYNDINGCVGFREVNLKATIYATKNNHMD